MKDTGQKLVEGKVAFDKAMVAMEGAYDSLLAVADEVEAAISEEVTKNTAAADNIDKAKAVMVEEVPLLNCILEAQNDLIQSRIAMEEIAQAITEEDIKTIEGKYDGTIVSSDNRITAILKGGDISGVKIVATDNAKIQAAAQRFDKDHEQFQAPGQDNDCAASKSGRPKQGDGAGHGRV